KVNYTKSRLKLITVVVFLITQGIVRLMVCWNWMKMDAPIEESISKRSWWIVKILTAPIYIFHFVLTLWLLKNSGRHSKLLDSVRVVAQKSKAEHQLIWKFNLVFLSYAVGCLITLTLSIVSDSILNLLRFSN